MLGTERADDPSTTPGPGTGAHPARQRAGLSYPGARVAPERHRRAALDARAPAR